MLSKLFKNNFTEVTTDFSDAFKAEWYSQLLLSNRTKNKTC